MAHDIPEVQLVKPNIIHAAELAEIGNNPKIKAFLPNHFPSPYTFDHALRFIDLANQAKDESMHYIVSYQNQVAGVGSIFFDEDVKSINAEVGYWVGEPFWNKGIATQVVQQLVEICFEDLKIRRVYAEIIQENIPSIRVLKKCNFQQEYVLPKAALLKGELHNLVCLGIVNKNFRLNS